MAMSMKENDDYRMRDDRELSSRDRESTYRDRDMNRDRNLGSRDWRDDDYRYSQESNNNRYASGNSSSFGQGNYNRGDYQGNYNQGSYQGANYGQGSTYGRGATTQGQSDYQGGYSGAGSYGSSSYGQGSYGNNYGGGSYGQSRGQMTRSHYRDGSQTYPNRDWNRDWSGPTDYRSSPYENDWGHSQYGSSEYGSNFRDSSMLGNERTRYGRNGSDFSASGFGTSYGSNIDRNSGYGAGDRITSGNSMFNRGDFHPHETMMEKVGKFFGMGPKNYKRSDSRIEEEVNDALVDDAFIDATNIEVKVKDGEVTLEGAVEDRMAKRRAEDLSANIRGVKDVHNHLKVQPTGETNIGSVSANTGLNTSDAKKQNRNTNAVS